MIMDKVFRDGSREDLRDEVRRHIGDAAAENCIGIRQELTSSVFILDGVHRRTEVLRVVCTTSPRIDLHVTTSPSRAQIAPEIDPVEDPFRRRCGTRPPPYPPPLAGRG